MNDKHAYCIIAHNEPLILEKLVKLIDDERNDIYVLIDLKADISVFRCIRTWKSGLFFIPRIDIRWGTISQIRAELELFKFASKKRYLYYHLLSGVDLPLKSQDYIHDFFQKNKGREFVGFTQDKKNMADLTRKTSYYYFFLENYKSNKNIDRNISHVIHKFLLQVQVLFHIKRTYDIELKKGCNWCSITNEFCSYLLEKEKYILEIFKYTLCGDEIFLQSILWNSPFRNNIYNLSDEFTSCMREIDWVRGNPYVWQDLDFEYLMSSNKLFARKFSSFDKMIVDKICKYLKN